MIVIIEGPDGSGKTTLAQHFVETHKMKYHHEGPTPDVPNVVGYYCDKFQEVIGDHRNVVIDRFALGERVYGPTLRSCDRLGLDGWKVFQAYLTQFQPVKQIVCLPPLGVCYRNWRQSNSEYFRDTGKFLESYSRFAYFVNAHSYLYFYDYTLGDSNDPLFDN